MGVEGWKCGIWSLIGKKFIVAKKPKLSTSTNLNWFHEELRILKSIKSFILLFSSYSINVAKDGCATSSKAVLLILPLLLLPVHKGTCNGNLDFFPWLDAYVLFCVLAFDNHITLFLIVIWQIDDLGVNKIQWANMITLEKDCMSFRPKFFYHTNEFGIIFWVIF
jgi:hypothetical protein